MGRGHGLVLTAGGTGTRMGADRPKQLLEIAGRSILDHALASAARAGFFTHVVVTLPAAHLDGAGCPVDWPAGARLRFVAGGESRQRSVARGIAALPSDLGWIWVHDAARPFVPLGIWRRMRRSLEEGARALAPGVEPADTIKRVDEAGGVVETVDRRLLRCVQTPQAFEAALLRRAHDEARREGREATDEAGLVEAMGEAVRIVDGDRRMMKITTPIDLACAEAIYRTYGVDEEMTR